MTEQPSRAGWQMWVPCIGMALCSWLSFVDRQVLAVLAPTILKETGLSAQDFGNVAFFFFVAYTLANPLWGSAIDFVGLRLGMLLAVALWTGASVAHAFVGSFAGFAAARALLGLGEGATFPGGLRTAVESLPSDRRARGIATAFAGGTLGAILTPLIMVPLATHFGWRAAFLATGAFGAAWLLLWAVIARPPFLPAVETKPAKLAFPDFRERRLWALVFSYALPAIAPGPVLTLMPIYLNRGLGVPQADLANLLWIPPAAWGLGYFIGGWMSDAFAAENRRPVGLFLILTVCAIPFGVTPLSRSVAVAIAMMSWACFIGGAFQMLALKVGSYSFPREQAAMMSGIASGAWSLVNALLAPNIGRLFDQQRWSDAFWLIALCPLAGVSVWLFLSRHRAVTVVEPRRASQSPHG